ncbi:MAG: tetratricopeptide repeat protein [Desulfuromusa sp.]|nr:tetratricopeptide repeat protein [Desulfuromusa sp.]
MKIQRFLSIKKIVFCLVPILFFISGCVAVNQSRLSGEDSLRSVQYRSEIIDPEAKALFSFSEFRLLGAENRWEEAIAALNRAISFDPNSDYLQLILAKAYLHRQQPEKAVATLELLLDRDPENVAGHELLGDVLSYQQNYILAIDHFRRALQLEPEDEALKLRLAMAFARLERTDEAITVLASLLEQSPGAALARLALARLYLGKKQTGKATEAYQQLLEWHPDQLQAVLEYGKLLEQKDQGAALELYQSFINRNPRAAAVRQQLSQYFLSRHQLSDALAQLQAVRQQFPANLQIINRIGLIQLELENWVEAESAFRLLLESDDDQGRSRYYLAMALSGQGQAVEAITILAPISRDSPIYTEAKLQLAYLYKQSDQNDQAIATLKQTIEQDIHHPDLYYYLVAFLGDSGDHEQALNVAQRGVEKNPDETQLLYQLGVLYEKLDKRQTAVQAMEKVLLLDDAHSDALNFLAYDQAENDINLELALVRAQKALAIKPSGYIVDTLGWIYFKMGRYPESREQLEKATELHPNDAVIQEHLGDLYRAMNLWQQAVAAYRRALEIDPQMTQVEEKLQVLLLETQ